MSGPSAVTARVWQAPAPDAADRAIRGLTGRNRPQGAIAYQLPRAMEMAVSPVHRSLRALTE